MHDQHNTGVAPVHLKALISANIRSETTHKKSHSWLTNLSVAAMFCVILGGVSKGIFDKKDKTARTTESSRVLKVLEGQSSGLVPYLNNARFSDMTSKVGATGAALVAPQPTVRSVFSRVMSVKSNRSFVRTNLNEPMVPSSRQRAQHLFLNASTTSTVGQRAPLTRTSLFQRARFQKKTDIQLCTDAIPSGLKAASSSFHSVMPTTVTPVSDE